MFFGEILTIFIEAHLELCLAGTIMMQVADRNQDNNSAMWLIGGAFLLISVGFMPGIMSWLIIQKK